MKSSHLVLLLQIFFIWLVNATPYNSDCPTKCGNVTILYPFGIKEGCYMDKSYYIECDPSTQIPRLKLSFSLDLYTGHSNSLEVLEVNNEYGILRVKLPIVYACYNRGKMLVDSNKTYHMSRFPFSNTLNRFVAVGCEISANIKLNDQIVSMNCVSWCTQLRGVKNRSPQGTGFCKTTIPPNITYAHISVRPAKNHTKKGDYNCGYAFIVEKNMYNFSKRDLSTISTNQSFPVVLSWSVENKTCEDAQKDKETYKCQQNSECVNGGSSFPGYRCKCSPGFRGNAYIPNGCQDVNECESPRHNDCLPGLCKNTYGSFTCVCPKGHQGVAKRGGKCTPAEKPAIEGISEGVVGAALTMIFVYWGVKRRRRIKDKKDFFKQNGGIMLQKMLFTCKDPVSKAKIFTEEELKKATENFNGANIIGQGGYGTVYKGILANKTLVAIKKSKVIDQSQIKQFVNEVIILSQISHPNVVKLLGCCLETHVPLLVYEYMTNNTLCHHIHTHSMLTIGKRLHIAEDTAEALAYMHSTTKIIHRDVKPSNILLNDDFNAKVSDFGISTFVPFGQTHLSTLLKGTIGYVDPEYFRTSKLTEKSDVYSFGVVLIELLTGKNIHSLDISLTIYRGAAEYLVSLLERNALDQVLDDQLKSDEYTEVVKYVAKIAINCLELEGKTRPIAPFRTPTLIASFYPDSGDLLHSSPLQPATLHTQGNSLR